MEAMKEYLMHREDLNYLINEKAIEEIYVMVSKEKDEDAFTFEQMEVSEVNMQVYIEEAYYTKSKGDSLLDRESFQNTHEVYVLKKLLSTNGISEGITIFNMQNDNIVSLSKLQYYLEPLVRVHFA